MERVPPAMVPMESPLRRLRSPRRRRRRTNTPVALLCIGLRFWQLNSYMMPMSKLKGIQARARQLARSGKFYGWPPLEFELRFEDGFPEAREWLRKASTREELDRICRKARTRRLRAGSLHEAA
jgi:hypothetical protein